MERLAEPFDKHKIADPSLSRPFLPRFQSDWLHAYTSAGTPETTSLIYV